jgi:pSer/pThr/pTyr-binding forkhead associated (FHA) protein
MDIDMVDAYGSSVTADSQVGIDISGEAVGRESNNDVELQDQRVSRHHAVLWAENGGWHVRDMDSGNGTFIGFTRVTGTAALPQSCDLRCHPNGPLISVHIGKSAETVVG